MAIVFFCQCGRQATAPDTAAGLRSRCPRCGVPVRVPAAPQRRPDPLDTPSWLFLKSQAKNQSPWGSRCT
jgi:hypothetical protein